MHMHFDQIRDEFAKLESEIADGPIVPNVTPDEIRAHLGSRYDFKQTIALDEVIADVEQMLRNGRSRSLILATSASITRV